MARRPVQYRGRTAYCDKHSRRYEWYRGCGDCEVAKAPPPAHASEDVAARRAHNDRIAAAVDAALKGGNHGEG